MMSTSVPGSSLYLRVKSDGTPYYYHLATINFSTGQMNLPEMSWQVSKSDAEVNRR